MPSNKWIILQHSMKPYDPVDAAAVTLFSLSTGLCVEKKLRRAKDTYFFIATAGSLIVLGRRVRPFQTWLLKRLPANIRVP